MQTEYESNDCLPTRYNFFYKEAPEMPKPGKGTKFAKFIASKVSSDMRFPILPSIFPAISTYLACVSFIYSDNKNYEMCGQMSHLIGTSGSGKAQLTHLIGIVMHQLSKHDKEEFAKWSTKRPREV